MMKFNPFASPLFRKLHANWLYRRGIVRAKLHKNQLSIADYSAVIDMAEAPASIRAMALYNRALVYHATSCESQAIADLQTVLKMSGATANVITEARRKLVRLERTSNRDDSRRKSRVALPKRNTCSF